MSPPEPHRSHTGPAWTRVLLITALLLGFGAMHTLGHLQHEAHASAGPPGAPLTEPTPAPHAPPASGASGPGHTPGTGAHPEPRESAAQLPELDPTSVCLTLGAFAAVLPGVAPGAFTRWPGSSPDPAAPVRCPSPSPVPTPDEPSLSRLQVLRV